MESPQVLKIRMDKSRDFSTVHGERPPGDPEAGVEFYQDGLPFNSRGFLVEDHVTLVAETREGEKLRKKVARRLEKLANAKPARVVDAASADDDIDEDDEDREDLDDDEDNDDEDDGPVPINLESWAKGEEEVPWQEVTQAIARRFSKRVANKRDALELLIAERVIGVGSLSPKNRKALEA